MSRKRTQRSENPFEYTDSNKRYYTYDYYLRRTFGGKCAKIPIDIGLSCPNIDGRCGTGGCIYCSGRGSGDFAESPSLSVEHQYSAVREKLSSKWSTERCIPYFQAHTNTYAPLDFLKPRFEAAMGLEGVVGMNIATRADCLEDDVVEYLAELAQRTVLTVELGLQTVHDSTALLINRGHTFADFMDGYNRLRAASDRINICVHLIFGLPEETEDMMMESVRTLAAMAHDQVKLHLLHVIKGTPMAELYLSGKYIPLEKQEYVRLVANAIELLPSSTVIARLTGDGMPDTLLAPLWSRKKVSVINDIDKLLYEKNSYQGRRFGGVSL